MNRFCVTLTALEQVCNYEQVTKVKQSCNYEQVTKVKQSHDHLLLY